MGTIGCYLQGKNATLINRHIPQQNSDVSRDAL